MSKRGLPIAPKRHPRPELQSARGEVHGGSDRAATDLLFVEAQTEVMPFADGIQERFRSRDLVTDAITGQKNNAVLSYDNRAAGQQLRLLRGLPFSSRGFRHLAIC